MAEAGGAFSNAAWFERAQRSLPGGVSSPVRAFKAVGGKPYVVERGEGASVWDVEGRRYLDYVQSYGASILGHAHPAVTEAIARAATSGASFGAPTPGEIELAEVIRERVPGVDLVRFVSSGTEAVMSAVRLARGCTGRSRVVLFAGCYHGHADGLLASGGSGMATLATPSCAGVPQGAVADVLVVPYNTVPQLDRDVACVVVEPVAANMGLVPPKPGWLQAVRQECSIAGALLVFDEVITGFRLGASGASGLFGVQPDLWCFGKVIGGGLPLAAFGGREDLMRELAPDGPVYQAGTLSGNPVAVAAGRAVLERLTPDVYEGLVQRAARLEEGLRETIGARGIAVQVHRAGPLVGVFFTTQAVTDFDGARIAADGGRYRLFFHAMLDEGVALAPGAYEVLFPSAAHSEADIDHTIEAAEMAASSMAHAEAESYRRR